MAEELVEAVWEASNLPFSKHVIRRTLNAVPDGWAKVDGEWVQFQGTMPNPHGHTPFEQRRVDL